eukprot:GHVU01016908.1.p1 GENE.GHVU01016908.1~~GHVU01016908.1.p1  ORF type:complete len:277 (+),score=10.61 GHVU01016908.1:963-1793(+)
MSHAATVDPAALTALYRQGLYRRVRTDAGDQNEYRERRQYWRRLRQIDLGCFRLQRCGVYWESRRLVPKYQHEVDRCWKFNHQIILKQLPSYRAKRAKLLEEYGEYSRREIEARRQDILLAHLSKIKAPRPGPPPPRWRPPSSMGLPIASRYDFDETMPISMTERWPRPETSESSGTEDSDTWVDELASSRDNISTPKMPLSSASSESTCGESAISRPVRKAKMCPEKAKAPPIKRNINYRRKSTGTSSLRQTPGIINSITRVHENSEIIDLDFID